MGRGWSELTCRAAASAAASPASAARRRARSFAAASACTWASQACDRDGDAENGNALRGGSSVCLPCCERVNDVNTAVLRSDVNTAAMQGGSERHC